MGELEVAFRKACDQSADVELFGPLWTDGTWWFISNRAGVVIGRGRTSREACEDWLGPVAVNP